MIAVRGRIGRFVVAGMLASIVALPILAATDVRYSDSGPEPQLARVFDAIEQNRWEAALEEADLLLRSYPNFRLGHLVRGDLLLARTRPIKDFGDGVSPMERDKIADLRDEAVARLHGYKSKPPANLLPRYLLQLRPDDKYAIVVDTQKSRLYLYQNDNGTPRFVADYYVTHGKLGTNKVKEGDQRTPIGVYHFTASLPHQKLSDLYGSGAFPINYPNEWDKRMGRHGHGIWLHGTPQNTFSRPPKASDGCVVLANQDLNAISGTLQIGLTPFIISNSIEWLSLDDWRAERKSLTDRIDAWRLDWESLDIKRYTNHYSAKFQSDGENRAQWIERKRNVNAGKTWIKVATSNISMFRDPGKEEYVVVTFEQDYKSNNVSNTMTKRQYWIKEDGDWKIIYEGAG